MPRCCVSSKRRRPAADGESAHYQKDGECEETVGTNVNKPRTKSPTHSPAVTALTSPPVLLSEVAKKTDIAPSPSDSFASCQDIPKSEWLPDSTGKAPDAKQQLNGDAPRPIVTASGPITEFQDTELHTVDKDITFVGVQSVHLEFSSASDLSHSPDDEIGIAKCRPSKSRTTETTKKRWSSFMTRRSKHSSRNESRLSEHKSTQSHRVSTVTYMARSIRPKVTTRRVKDATKLIKSSNPNRPSDYVWLREGLALIKQKDCPYPAKPLFFICGACPSSFAGMQSVMYAWTPSQKIECWWVKPMKSDPSSLEKGTMTLNTKQPHKNDPGRSKSIYQPLADYFTKKAVFGNIRFSIEVVEGQPRALLYDKRADGRGEEALHLHLVWQEDWTTNPFAKKYLKGKMVFRRDSLAFYARQFMLEDGSLKLEAEETEDFMDPFCDGDNDVKDYYEP